MASTGFLADFSRRPLIQKIGVFFLLLVLVLGAWYQLFYSKVLKDIDAAKANAASLTSQKTKLEKDEIEYKRLDEEQAKLKKLIADNDSALPTAAQLPAVFEMLNRKVGEAGVEVRKWDYQKEVPVDETIYKVPVAIELQGSFYQLERFFYLLYKVNQKEGDDAASGAPNPAVDTQERDRILTVEDLRIGDPVVENNELVLTATFRASTFRKEEAPPPSEAAPKAKAGDKAKKTAGGGLLDAPAKAKEKTGDAMDKDAARSGDGSGAERVKGGM
jgi:Tfp pilus assembly protein PilO